MRWLCVLALCGCDRFLKLEPAAVPVPDAGLPTCASPLIMDVFAGPTPCSPWGAPDMPTCATVTEMNHELTFTMPNTCGVKCKTTAEIALPTGGIILGIDKLPGGTNSVVTLESAALGVVLDNFAGELNLAPPAVSAPPYSVVQYDFVMMRYWRLLPDPTQMIVVASYSPDGFTWTDLPRSAPLSSVPATVDVQIKANVSGAGSPQDAAFSYLLACP